MESPMPLEANIVRISSHTHNAADTDATVRRLRVELGQCPGCGTECNRVKLKLFKKSLIALTEDGVVSHGRCLYCHPDPDKPDSQMSQDGPARQDPPATEDDISPTEDSFHGVEKIPQTTSGLKPQAGVTSSAASLRTSYEDVAGENSAGEEASAPEKQADTLSCIDETRSTADLPEGMPHHVVVPPPLTSTAPFECGHTDRIQSLALMSPTEFLTGADDASIKLWSTSGRCIRTFTGHDDWIWSVAKLDDSSFLSASYDKTVKLWDVNKVACVHTFEGHSEPVKSVVRMGLYLFLSGSGDRTIRLWDAITKKCLGVYGNRWTKKGHEGKVNALADLDTDFFLSGSEDKTIMRWDTDKNVVVNTFEGHKAYVHSIAKLGTYCQSFASGSEDGTARIWDIRSGRCTGVLHGHTKCIRAISPMNDNQLLTASGDKTVKLWDMRIDRCPHTFYDHKNEVTCLVRLDEERFLSGSIDKTVKMWNNKTGVRL